MTLGNTIFGLDNVERREGAFRRRRRMRGAIELKTYKQKDKQKDK